MKTAVGETIFATAASGLRQRMIQVHPGLLHNLPDPDGDCQSDPAAEAFLDPTMLCLALTDAARMGYELVSFSGGESLLYWGLDRALAHAKSQGLRTTVTTNGTLLTEKRLSRIKGRVDFLAISLSGPAALFNRSHNSPRAFSKLLTGLDSVRKAGIPFGFIHTLTQNSGEHLLWLADFAVEQGAALLRVHPLERTRYGEQLRQQDCPQEDMLARLSLLTVVLDAHREGRLAVQLDIFSRDMLLADPELVYAAEFSPCSWGKQPADLLSPIIVEADGSILPVCSGFSRTYAVCNLEDESLAQAWPRYVKRVYPAFRRLCHKTFVEEIVQREVSLVNWHELIVVQSHSPTSDTELNYVLETVHNARG